MIEKDEVVIKIDEYRELLIAYGQYQIIMSIQQTEIEEENLIGFDTNEEPKIKCKKKR